MYIVFTYQCVTRKFCLNEVGWYLIIAKNIPPCSSGTRSHRRLIFRIMNSHRMYSTLCVLNMKTIGEDYFWDVRIDLEWPCQGRRDHLEWPCQGRRDHLEWPCQGRRDHLEWPCAYKINNKKKSLYFVKTFSI